MLKVRNQLAHDYDGLIVKEHCQTIVNEYIDKMYEFKIAVETLLKEDKYLEKTENTALKKELYEKFGNMLKNIGA